MGVPKGHSHLLKPAQIGAVSHINLCQVSKVFFLAFLAKICSFLWDKVDYKNRVILQKQGRNELLAVGTCLAKFDYDLDLDLDESWQFLSSLGLNDFSFPSLPSSALLIFPGVL